MSMSKTKKQLVDVARQLFAKNGMEDTTMNDIAVASKKGRRTLYTYFKSKDDIYLAVIESELDMLIETMKVVAAKDEQTFDIETATAGSATLTVTGARYMFWGSHADYETLDSAKIRAHANGGAAASAAQTVEITIPESGVKQFYVALPSGRSLTKIYNTAAGESFGDITASFTVDTTPITVAVEGANNYAAANYTVYYFNSGTSWVGPNTLTVIIG